MKQILKISLIVFTLFYLLGCGKKEVSQTPQNILEAKVTLVKGEAYILRTDEPEKIAVKIGTKILPSDVLITGKDSYVNVAIKNRGILKIKENSNVTFKELLVIDDLNNATKIQVSAGKVVLGLKKLVKDSKFEVETPKAVAGVRGTSFLVAVYKEDTAGFPYFVKITTKENVVTKLGVLSGKVELKDLTKPEQKVIINALKEATLVNDDFENIKIEKISMETLNEIGAIKELSEIKEYKLEDITDEIKSVEPQIEMIQKGVKTKSEIKTKEEDLKETEENLKEEVEIKEKSSENIKKQKKESGKYLNDESGSW